MQVNQNQIQRPLLIELFFDKELTPDNQFVEYIDCSTNSSSVIHKKNVTPASHDIEKSLKSKKFGVRFEFKYSQSRFYMNEAGFINIDMQIFYKSELP